MNTAVSVSIPRWQWRTVAADLSWLVRRLPAPPRGAERRVEETHLVCSHSTHSAVLREGRLTLDWRKERAPEGFELWDRILDLTLPFRAADLERLWAAWELPRPAFQPSYPAVASFLTEATASGLLVVALTRHRRDVDVEGITCSIETIGLAQGPAFQTFSMEHEDPSLMLPLLADLGLRPGDNIHFLQGLRAALGLQALDAGSDTWPRKSNASSW